MARFIADFDKLIIKMQPISFYCVYCQNLRSLNSKNLEKIIVKSYSLSEYLISMTKSECLAKLGGFKNKLIVVWNSKEIVFDRRLRIDLNYKEKYKYECERYQ